MSTMRSYNWRWLLPIAAWLITNAAAYAGPVGLQAYTGVIAGANECPGGGPGSTFSFFSIEPTFGFGNGGNGISDCGLAGSTSNITNAGTTPANSATVLNNAGFVGGTGNYNGNANASANFGSLSAGTSGALVGTEPANGTAEAVGFAIAQDTINIAGSGTGSVSFQFTINGGLSQGGADLSEGEILVQLQLGSSPDPAFYGNISESSSLTEGSAGGSIPGCTDGTGSFECTNGIISTVALPITFGTATDFDLGLLASTDILQGTSSVDPFPGLSLTGIDVFDANGAPIDSFSITSGSGAVYGANGLISEPPPVSAVPEPFTLSLFGTGLACAVAMRRRKKAQKA
jgi:hypothetical protein